MKMKLQDMGNNYKCLLHIFRAFPMVSSLISPQYHDSSFWKSTVSVLLAMQMFMTLG
jgi:hypothetical protein